MIIWRGLGILVLPIYFASIMLGSGLCDYLSGDPSYFNGARWPACLTALVTAGIVFALGRRLNRPVYIMPNPGGLPIRVDSSHDLFFIKMEYWAIPIILLAIGLLAP